MRRVFITREAKWDTFRKRRNIDIKYYLWNSCYLTRANICYVLEKGNVKNINCAFRHKLNFIHIVEKPANVMDGIIFQKVIQT